MAIREDLAAEVKKIFKDAWDVTSGRVVPIPSSVGLGNKAVELENAAVLYADLDGSTNMVDKKKWEFSAEIYKTYLYCAAKIIKAEDGSITSYDGDRIMGIFIGEGKSDRAARCGLKLNYAVKKIIQPAIQAQYTKSDFKLAHVVGVDLSQLRAARTGVRGDNDLVWVGRAANYAAKMTTLPSDYPTWITKAVYDELTDGLRMFENNAIWEARSWTRMNKMSIYRSNWQWTL